MNRTVFTLTLRQFLGQRRSLLLLLLALAPVGLAVVYRIGEHLNQQEWAANVLLNGIVITTVLPLACLIFGVSALGSEIEEGTVVFILAKPVPRHAIITAKFAACALVVAAFMVPAAAVSGLIALEGVPEQGIAAGFAVATLVGVFAYSAVFILLSVMSSRPLLFGLGYVFIWEGIVTALFSATRWLSIRQYCLGIARFISSASENDFEADLAGPAAIILIAAVTAGALFLASRRLERLELSETD